MRNIFLTLIILLSIPSFLHGAPYVIQKDIQRYPVLKNSYYLADTRGDLSFKTVRKSTDWQKIQSESVNFGFTETVYWFRFIIKKDFKKNGQYFLQIDYPMLDYVDLYSQKKNGGFKVHKTGDRLTFDSREIDDKNLMFTINPTPEGTTYYLRIETTSSINFALNILTTDAYIAQLKDDLPAFWAYYGLMAVMLIYNFLIFVITRNTSYFFYIYFLASWIFFQFTLNGFSFQYLWPNMPGWANQCLPFFISMVTVGCGFMLRTFLKTKKKYPLIDKIALFLIIVPGLVWSFTSLLMPYKISIKGATAIALLGSLTMIILSIILLFRGSRDARFFLFSWLFMMTGIILYTLKTFGVLPANFLTNWSIQIGSSATAILLSGALAGNINIMRRQVLQLNDDLKEKEAMAKSRAIYLEQIVNSVSGMSDSMMTISNDLTSLSDKFSLISDEHDKTSSDMLKAFEMLRNEYEQLQETLISQRQESTKTRELSGELQESQISITRSSETVAESINQVLTSNHDTEETLRKMIDKMSLIDHGGKSINDVMHIIDDITDRINLLSLNAAIEAARAGEHGRGFAVVADEIGKLALATSDNSKLISGQVSAIIKDISEGTELVSSTKSQLELTFEIINTITERTEEVKMLIAGQDSGINQIVTQSGVMDELAKDIENTTEKQNQTIKETISIINNLAEMAKEISLSNSRILELTAMVKEKSIEMNDAIKNA